MHLGRSTSTCQLKKVKDTLGPGWGGGLTPSCRIGSLVAWGWGAACCCRWLWGKIRRWKGCRWKGRGGGAWAEGGVWAEVCEIESGALHLQGRGCWPSEETGRAPLSWLSQGQDRGQEGRALLAVVPGVRGQQGGSGCARVSVTASSPGSKIPSS